MVDNYAKIIQDNLTKLYNKPKKSILKNLPCNYSNNSFEFSAFGKKCNINKDKITLNGKEITTALGIIISLYALNDNSDQCILEPLIAFKDFPNSMPYADAFATHTQNILIPYVEEIEQKQKKIIKYFHGSNTEIEGSGDFSFFLQPLPKIFLCYIFYRPDEDFSASVTCLYSSNAFSFLHVDALADVSEYTSRAIIDLIKPTNN